MPADDHREANETSGHPRRYRLQSGLPAHLGPEASVSQCVLPIPGGPAARAALLDEGEGAQLGQASRGGGSHLGRQRALLIEAAEQSGRLTVPPIEAPVGLDAVIAAARDRPAGRGLPRRPRRAAEVAWIPRSNLPSLRTSWR